MPLNRNQTSLFHVVKAKLGWSDEIYREVLARIGGVTSSTELDQDGFNAIMAFAEYSGFRPTVSKTPRFGDRPGFATFAQLTLIRELWREVHRQRECDDDHLAAWLHKYHKVDSLRFLTMDAARKVIVTLKSWKSRRSA
ncbi:MAG: regulatory protein GemA [Rhodobacter sp.]|nr:regulatory protein GemA [Rhodobacter sp.]MCA3470598.1 regulatory protein GemA [Rhodobacter sp.]MCA3481122.1 regulatory protein GemA [Rhodobacter sp.]MCA3496272.1 regulatory protein GemA [Rhodobacter sp.]MCA4927201.1 regulatory protein GemA [Rhodobacter sp.]